MIKGKIDDVRLAAELTDGLIKDANRLLMSVKIMQERDDLTDGEREVLYGLTEKLMKIRRAPDAGITLGQQLAPSKNLRQP